MSTVEEYLKQLNKQTAANTEKKVEAVNNAAATSGQIIKDNYDLQIKQNNQIYEDALDENAVQRRINEHMILRDLTNTGDTNSGLSRTQMTAVQLSHANNQAKIKRQQQAAYEGFMTAMNSELSKIETDKATQVASIRTADYDANYNKAVSMYNAEQKAISDSITASGDIDISSDPDYGVLGNSLYSNDMVTQITDNYIRNKENKDSLVNEIINIQAQNGLNDETAAAIYDAVKQRTESIRAFNANPTLLKYTLVSQPKGGTYDGEVANTAVIRDQFGVERTIEDVYYMIKRMHAKAEAARKYVPNFNNLSAELQKQHMANVSEDDINVYINTKAVKDAAKKAIKQIQNEVGITK